MEVSVDTKRSLASLTCLVKSQLLGRLDVAASSWRGARSETCSRKRRDPSHSACQSIFQMIAKQASQVDDLFFNTPLRKKALKSTVDEYTRILDVVSRCMSSMIYRLVLMPS